MVVLHDGSLLLYEVRSSDAAAVGDYYTGSLHSIVST